MNSKRVYQNHGHDEDDDENEDDDDDDDDEDDDDEGLFITKFWWQSLLEGNYVTNLL